MQLYGTPPSHFTRKVRVVLQELKIPYEFVLLDKLLEVGEEKFAKNPLHLFPVLVDGDEHLFDSDRICDYLLERYGNGKELSSFFPSGESKTLAGQRLVIMNGGMSAGVSLIRAQRSGIENLPSYPFFRQERAALEGSQRWLNQNLGPAESFYPGHFTMLDITLQCFLEWAEFRELLLPWSEIPNLQRFVRAQAPRPSFRSTHPSLAKVTK